MIQHSVIYSDVTIDTHNLFWNTEKMTDQQMYRWMCRSTVKILSNIYSMYMGIHCIFPLLYVWNFS